MSTPSSACPLPRCASWDLHSGILVVLPVILPALRCETSWATLCAGAGSLCGVLADPGGPCTSAPLASQCLLLSGESCSLHVFGSGVLIRWLKKTHRSPSSAKMLFKEGQRSPAVWLNDMDES